MVAAADPLTAIERLEKPEETVRNWRRITRFIPIAEESMSQYGQDIPHRVWCLHECRRLSRHFNAVAIARRNGCAAVVVSDPKEEV